MAKQKRNMYDKLTLVEKEKLASSRLFYDFVNNEFLKLTKEIHDIQNLHHIDENGKIIGIIYYHKTKESSQLYFRSYVFTKTGRIKFTKELKAEEGITIDHRKLKYNFTTKEIFLYK